MIIFLCASILLHEWDDFDDDNMMECIQKAKGLKLEKDTMETYIKNALKMSKEFVMDRRNVKEFNSILLKG